MAKNSYSIKFAPKAEEDLEEIYSYISEKLLVTASADNLLEKIEKSIMKLQYFPSSGSLLLDEPLRKKGYRKLIIENYIAFYIVDKPGKQVIIMRILYGAQNYQDLL
jgi:toxin ParE1/3/4